MIGTSAQRLSFLDSIYPEWPGHTLWTCFYSQALRYGEAPYLICQDKTYTYGQALHLVNQVSKSLFALGIRPGDHVVISLYNGLSYLSLIFALAKLGAVKIPLNMHLKSWEKQYIIKHSSADWVIGIQLPELCHSDFPALKNVLTLDDWESFLDKGRSVDEALISELEQTHRNPDSISDILYTSGSTSFPKGVMLTHDILLRTSYATCRTRLMEEGRRILVPIPFYHIFAYSEGILASMHAGGSIVISEQKFDALNCLSLMRKHDVNDIICVPLIAIKMIQYAKPDTSDFPCLHAAFISPAGPDWLWQSFKDTFGITDVTTGYGMTECGATSTILSPLAPPSWINRYVGGLKDAGTAGICPEYPHLLRLKICDPDTGLEVPAGQSGEILCKGLTISPGYYHDEEANSSAFLPNGWFRTGDIGLLDHHGMLTFQGRKNDMYKINGENVSPQQLELIISQCPGVRQVEVLGLSHETYGEIGIAFIDANVPDDFEKKAIESYCQNHLASFQVPKYFIYESQENWPRTATNKVQKGKLRERALEFLARHPAGI